MFAKIEANSLRDIEETQILFSFTRIKLSISFSTSASAKFATVNGC